MALSHARDAARSSLRTVIAFVLGAILAGASALLMVDAKAAPVANVVFCGFGDPAGGCIQALIDMGHIAPGERVEAPWYPADLNPFGPGMTGSTDQGMPGALEAINRLHAEGYSVRVHGYSQGSDLALAAANAVKVEEVLLYGSPFPEKGAFHAYLLDENGAIRDVLGSVGKLSLDRPIPQGTFVQAYYNESDVWANFVPNEDNLGVVAGQLIETLAGQVHWIQPKFGATCEFTDKFGVLNHVFADANPLTRNGCEV